MSFQQLHHLPLFAAALASPHAPLLPWEAWEGRPLGWEPKWIFVGGFARSGTTLVAAAALWPGCDVSVLDAVMSSMSL